MKNLLVAVLAVGMVVSSAMAREHAGHGDGGPFDGSARPFSDYGDGVLTGILLSTATLFASHITAEHSENVYLYADNDAAEFLANNGQQKPTMALAAAMDHQRNFLAQAQVSGAENLTDLDLAYLVMKRAEAIK